MRLRERVAALPRLGMGANQPGCAPDIGVASLIPVDETLAAGDARDCCPAASKTHIMLAIEEVGSVSGIENHGLEAFMSSQRCAGPFPQSSVITLTTKMIISGDRSGMPVLETDVPPLKVDEQVIGVGRALARHPIWEENGRGAASPQRLR